MSLPVLSIFLWLVCVYLEASQFTCCLLVPFSLSLFLLNKQLLFIYLFLSLLSSTVRGASVQHASGCLILGCQCVPPVPVFPLCWEQAQCLMGHPSGGQSFLAHHGILLVPISGTGYTPVTRSQRVMCARVHTFAWCMCTCVWRAHVCMCGQMFSCLHMENARCRGCVPGLQQPNWKWPVQV